MPFLQVGSWVYLVGGRLNAAEGNLDSQDGRERRRERNFRASCFVCGTERKRRRTQSYRTVDDGRRRHRNRSALYRRHIRGPHFPARIFHTQAHRTACIGNNRARRHRHTRLRRYRHSASIADRGRSAGIFMTFRMPRIRLRFVTANQVARRSRHHHQNQRQQQTCGATHSLTLPQPALAKIASSIGFLHRNRQITRAVNG
jgi:hypothetical protein